ncbi:BadF/BadG/BcrA/BcrD ATPase family protein [Oceaniglobus roseus]|uniref:BadF/BadG/BcrA/BcrD ATPase family protein n=1 Tax=Oceaniglobus roseus TaxID=1737570 RepID=UPI0012FFDCBB|nr:BadF/BadG/BcrA/BcrD ATPase family protein [Kandeliimicrobium roseum]
MATGTRQLLIGIDGGGSGCRAAARWSDGPQVFAATGGPANATTDRAQALSSVRAVVARVAALAGAQAAEIAAARARIGLAGIMDEAMGRAFAELLPMRAEVGGDLELQVGGALGSGDGFVLAIGTGTIVAGRTGGRLRRAGGWGFPLSDQASGADLGRAVLRRVLLCEDGIADHSGLTRALLAELGGDPRGLVAFAVGAKAEDYARFAPRIVAAAAAGDTQALAAMLEAAAYLDRALTAVGFRPGARLCLMGGVGPAYAPYLASAAQATLIAPAASAVDHALALAAAL